MEKCDTQRLPLGLIAVLMLTACAGTACSQQNDRQVTAAGSTPQLEQLKAAGKGASLTVLPAGLGGSVSGQVGEAVGLFLERAGMKNLEIGTAEFRSPDGADLEQAARALGEFVHANPPPTDYVLFADFQGTPGKGVSEVRGIIVNKAGEVVWQDRQTAADADFKRIKPSEPMDCIRLTVERLRPVLGLGDPTRADAPTGKLAKRWQETSGVPDDAELAAIKERQQAFKKAAATATVLVYPARTGDQVSADCATHLANLINDAKLMKATAAEQGPQLATKGDTNEQKVLWGMARAFREYVQKRPPNAEYVLFADYLMGKDTVGGVHFAVCDRQGQLVIVDFQNDHQADFKAIQPKSREDCDRLVLKRLQTYCK